ncbi:MAG: SBBP repeat-containing protein [Bryobacteraceae bacterium]|nr:SBBP repeat-containing protein [Bryobacteraceae bacterium]
MIPSLRISALILCAASALAAAPAGRQTKTNRFFGNDPRRWHTEVASALPSRTAASSAPYSVFIGGTRDIHPVRIAADSQGNVYIAGNFSWRNPSSPALVDVDPFIMRLDPDGNVVYATYFGGSDWDTVSDLAVDSEGRVYVVGSTGSLDFPILNALQPRKGGASDAFITALSPAGGFLYSTYFGGSGGEAANGIAVDATGAAYVTGSTGSPDFPVTEGAFQTRQVQPDTFRSPSNGFVLKLAPAGDGLVYSTLLGGTTVTCIGGSRCVPATTRDAGTAIAVDAEGNAFIAGRTNTTDFPVTPGALRTACDCTWSSPMGFLAKLNPAGSALVYSTYIGGPQPMEYFPGTNIAALAIDGEGNAYITGSSSSLNFPTTAGAFRSALDPARIADRTYAYVAKLNSAGSALAYSTLLSGNGEEAGNAIRVDAQGNAYVAGRTAVAEFPLTSGAFNRGGDFFTKLNPTGAALLFSTLLPTGFGRQALALGPEGDAHLLGDNGYVARIEGATNRLPAILGVSNAAGDRLSGRLSPGELISIFGNHIGPAEPAGLELDADGRVSTVLAGVRVFIDGVPAPLTYAQSDQVNAVTPAGLLWTGAGYPLVEVLHNDQIIGGIRLRAVTAEPEVFRVAGDSQAAALNEDGSVNSSLNPARLGSLVTVFATGFGATDSPVTDGDIPVENLPRPMLPVSVQTQYSPTPIEVTYAGQAPALVFGVVQVNFRIPVVQTGDRMWFTVKAGDFTSGSFTIFVTP